MTNFQCEGFCPICEKPTVFRATGPWLRDDLMCLTCPLGSVPRERALALILNEVAPRWRDMAIHESSPAERGISVKLKQEAPRYVGTQYYPGRPQGVIIDGFRNENLQDLTFASASHDIFVSLDVFEHLPEPQRALLEIYRTLKRGGLMVSTFPIRKCQTAAVERRVTYDDKGEPIFVKEPEYHGNPIDPRGSIVTVDYGYDLHSRFGLWAPFDVRIYRFSDRYHGIVGEYTDVVVCWKR